ncbi:phosphotransferase system mannitol/fructose-specific IIA domain [Bellilinea caldifistulae]|uniref:PTS sugar transporter subunit IIA n=1 Tax=Bellilinea caldifistulae TaxID=360411 RepID=UPI000785E1B0|nr:PTS sugar transporter subunit IIA [Bellilinea caldifistulae]GAP09653.1 phosphotransferase system mannitol/fructose-specific IIA domain [Bellilinea caldifistulae]
MLSVLNSLQIIRFEQVLDRRELLTKLADTALQNGWVKEGFTQVLLEREEKYPTGIHAPGSGIAIPHADAEWTLVPGMIVAILQQPVAFEPMGGQGGEVQAHLVFLLLISDPDDHVAFLSALADFISDAEKIHQLRQDNEVSLLLNHLKQAGA